MKILLCYICVTHGAHTRELASRFVGSYLACPAGAEHTLAVACNGGPLDPDIQFLFDPIEARFLPRENDPGWDVSAYQEIASLTQVSGPDYDMIVCLGESCYFHRAGWLKRIVDVWERSSPGMYGFFSSNLICPHLCTTAFAIPPAWLGEYPQPKNFNERYQFEHGEHSFWRAMKAKGRPVKLVTWDGCYDPWRWRQPQDILWRGSQANCLLWANHTDRYRAQTPATQRKWARAADAPFR